MRVIVVIGLCAVVSAAAGGEGTTKPSELKVLDRCVGTWDCETVNKPAAWRPTEVREKHVEIREWILDGWFVEGKSRTEDGKAGDLSMMMTYDLAKKEYRIWMFQAGGLSFQVNGQWEEATKTFLWTGDLGGGITSKTTTHFIDKDHYEFHYTAKDGDGKVYQDMKGMLTRRVGKR